MNVLIVFLVLLGYLAVGFIIFLITLGINKLFNSSLFTDYVNGKIVKDSSMGLFIVIAWPLLAPILVFVGICNFIHRVCDMAISKTMADQEGSEV